MTKRLPPNEWHKDDDLLAVDLNDTFAAKVPAQATAPTSPYVGMVWVDTTDPANPKGMVWNGTKWSSFSGGLTGLGGWADVTATTGSPTKHAYTDANGYAWVAYEWTAAGSITATPGLLECFLISGGSGGDGVSQGAGGRVAEGLYRTTLTTAQAIVVGSAGSVGGGAGSRSYVANVVSTGYSSGYWGGAGAFIASQSGAPDLSQGAAHAGWPSSITGVSVDYGQVSATPRANRGDGSVGAIPGSTGVVIVRVPADNAKA
jgi:hypothetical protein